MNTATGTLNTLATNALDSIFDAEDTVLVAPLNWGLGHATRCIPVIAYLRDKCRKVIVTSDGESLQLLQREFPELTFETLPSYKIQYPTASAVLNMAVNLPGMVAAYFAERKKISALAKKHGASAVLSDNRPGIRVAGLKNVYMTHQLQIKHGFRPVSLIASSVHRYFIRKYDHCLVPDFNDDRALAPGLSAPATENAIYIGPLTRIRHRVLPCANDILVLLSGPEPQRSILENRLFAVLSGFSDSRILFVRGTTLANPLPEVPAHIKVASMLDSSETETALNSSGLFIGRCGYSTLMDINSLPLRAIFIPTPGQTEQEYLADNLPSSKPYFAVKQENLSDLAAMIRKISGRAS